MIDLFEFADNARAQQPNAAGGATQPPSQRPVSRLERPITGHIYTLPPGQSFLESLAAHLIRTLDAGGADPFALADTTVLLPTRRATRALQDAFLRAAPTSALLLPKIQPIGEADEDANLLYALASRTAWLGDGTIAPAVSELERRLVLAMLVQRWSATMRGANGTDKNAASAVEAAGAQTPAQAMHMARDLARLIDTIETENADLAHLKKLVPDQLSEHWQLTLDFLQIVMQWWPAHLAEVGRLSPADRRNKLIRAEADRLRRMRPTSPVIVAGVTGSIPATAELISAVLELGNGWVVLPGLDQTIDDDAWADIRENHPEHPQRGLARLLDTLGVDRTEVRPLAGHGIDGQAPSPKLSDRERLIGEALRPATTSHEWWRLPESVSPDQACEAFANVHYLTAPTAQDEAEAIALIMRQAAEDPTKTAALVSPDRLLARRVATRLESWGIRIDDSAGRPFAKTVPGAFLDLTIEAFAQAFAPKPLMALLKHPLTRLGLPVLDIRRAARALEIAAFRAPYIASGLDGITAALERQLNAVETGSRRDRSARRMRVEDWQSAGNLIDALRAAFGPLLALEETGEHDLAALATAHLQVAEALARLPAERNEDEPAHASPPATSNALWQDEAGHAAAQLFARLIDPELPAPELTAASYPDFYRALISGESVRTLIPVHPRLAIWGPFEARLQRPDIVILGSLNEGTWPEAADPGPWLNRPMRQQLGLPLPEERIGHAAHDVSQLMGAETVYLTRAEKIDASPTVPSRWLLRLNAVLQGIGAKDALATDQPWIAWARARDHVARRIVIPPPAPAPPVALRPRKLSVSAIETWIANPYALYAQRILKLDPLAPLGVQPDASLRGSIVHEALGRFADAYPESLPADSAAALLLFAEEIFTEYASHPTINAFWIERFRRFADWFGASEPARRHSVTRTLAELHGEMVLEGPAGPFKLTARADRIDTRSDTLSITDYKTAASLTTLTARARSGEAPQLLLEAAIALAGGFEKVPVKPIGSLQYISASGGEPAGIYHNIKLENIAASAEAARDDLVALIAQYDDPETPYRAIRRHRFDYDYDSYAHLARVAEWSATAVDRDTKTPQTGGT